MRYKFFGKNIDPACEYCAFGRPSSDTKNILCSKKGVTSTYYSCRRFKYDPLKRVPKQPPRAKDEFKAEDFEL